MYGGAIASQGPRYCPSVEDKVVKFPDAVRHQLFLEPEGHDTHELYVNGLSTSLPATVQLEVLRTIAGLEDVRMTRAGYAIEYDYYPPTQLDATLQSRAIAGLFFAGQVNGTTGYEEAAGQGVVAGINAARVVREHAPLVLGRETSYIGVLVDDLVTRGVDEPYRLFTSRSEFRLTVRQDNALARLAPIGAALGLYDERELACIEARGAAEARGTGAGRFHHDRAGAGGIAAGGHRHGAADPRRADRRGGQAAGCHAGCAVRGRGRRLGAAEGGGDHGGARAQVRWVLRARTAGGGPAGWDG